MQTPWGDLPVADAHIHFFSHRFLHLIGSQMSEKLDPRQVADRLGWPPVPEMPEALAQQWVAELDRHGVGHACLIASLPGDTESVIRAIHVAPDRFSGYFFVDPTQTSAVEQVEAALTQGMRGVCLLPAMHRFPIAGEAVDRVLEVAQRHPGTVIFVQCGVLSVGIRKRLGLPSPFDLRFANPVDLHPVALKHPSLRFVIPHFGAGFFREALMVCDLCPNVYLDTSSSNNWTRYLTPRPSLATVFEQALEICGSHRLLFGTDSSFFPRGWNHAVLAEQLTALREAGADADQARRILSSNLLELLGRDR